MSVWGWLAVGALLVAAGAIWMLLHDNDDDDHGDPWKEAGRMRMRKDGSGHL